MFKLKATPKKSDIRNTIVVTTSMIATPSNTVSKRPTKGPYISMTLGTDGTELYTVMEKIGDEYKVHDLWSAGEQGDSKWKDLPVVFNQFPVMPMFKS